MHVQTKIFKEIPKELYAHKIRQIKQYVNL